MTYPRRSLISLAATPYYHVIARCVRRAWLWGVDEYAGKDYSHRKAWVLERLEQLSAVFSIDVCAYAVMSNHYHLVLHVDQARARQWSEQDVLERWTRLFTGPALIQRWRQGQCGETERTVAREIIEHWRQRLCDISWYMRCLNEHLARRANHEDGCTGRFWEGRFRSQALLDEAGLLTAMAYVDLNPIRAGIASTPETSDFTSIQSRIDSMRPAHPKLIRSRHACVTLLPFRGAELTQTPCIPFGLLDYIELVEWTGRIDRSNKRGAIDTQRPPILERLAVQRDGWLQMMRPRSNAFGRALGRTEQLRRYARELGQSRVRGLGLAARLYVADD